MIDEETYSNYTVAIVIWIMLSIFIDAVFVIYFISKIAQFYTWIKKQIQRLKIKYNWK